MSNPDERASERPDGGAGPDRGEPERGAASGPTPLLLITGFLGSGKTTLINRFLRLPRRPGQPRLGVVVNEFGQVGVDGTLLQGTSGILELANGCVCCIKGTELWESALDLVDKAGAEVLLVETSGLVEPAALLEQYEVLPARLRPRLSLLGLLCLVDVPHVHEALGRRREARQQIELAERLLLTKLDRASPAELLQAHHLLDELGASSERVGVSAQASDDEIAQIERWALAPAPKKRRPQAACAHGVSKEGQGGGCATCGPVQRHGGRQLVAVSVHEAAPLVEAPLRRLLDELPGEVLRAKGVVRLVGDGSPEPRLAVVQLAGGHLDLVPADAGVSERAAPGSTLVFIGEDLDEGWLRLRLRACRVEPAGPSGLAAT